MTKHCPVHNPSPQDKKREAEKKQLLKRVSTIQGRLTKSKSKADARRALVTFEKLLPRLTRHVPEMARSIKPFLHAAKKQFAA